MIHSFFSKVHNINKSVNELNTDLEKISQWAYQWKMQFKPHPNNNLISILMSMKKLKNVTNRTYKKILIEPPTKCLTFDI